MIIVQRCTGCNDVAEDDLVPSDYYTGTYMLPSLSFYGTKHVN